MKECVRCHIPKLLAEFAHKDAKHLRNWCRICDAERARVQHAKRHEGMAVGIAQASEYLGRLLRQAEYYEELRH